MQKKENSGYSGIDELDVLKDAHNYNNFLAEQVSKGLHGIQHIWDFGAGLGTFSKLLRNKGISVSCFEIDTELKENLIRENFSVKDDLKETPDNSIEGLYSLNVFEHIEDDEQVLIELYKKIKPGGKVYIYVPAFSILYSSFDKKVGHHRRYRTEDLEQKSKNAGFKIINSGYKDSLGFFIALLFKIISNSDTVSKSSIIIYDKIIFPISRFCDPLLGKFFGKNAEILLEKPE